MTFIPAAASVLAAANYTTPKANNAEWDTLYVAVTIIFVLLLVVALASWLNARDRRRA